MEFVMHHFFSKRRMLALALAIPFAGCSAQNMSALPSGGAPAAAAQRAPVPASISAFLYVLNAGGSSSSGSWSSSGSGTLNEYRIGRPRLLNSIGNGINGPRALTFDGKGNVYIVNDGGGSSSSWSGSGGSVTEYVGHGTQLLRTITRGINGPVADAIDPRGNLYVANDGGSSSSSSSSSSDGSVTVYHGGHFRLIDTITDGIFGPRALAFDGTGHLYVLNTASGPSSSSSSSSSSGGSVTIYDSARRLIGTLSGMSAPVAMAVDPAGDVMVANAGSSSSSSGSTSGSVVVFAAGSSSPTATITDGISNPRALALDGSGNLYVANVSGGSSSSSSSSAGGSVTIYGAGSTTPALAITDGIGEPDSLAIAPNGWLYVGNVAGSSSSSSSSSGGDVQVYLPGHASARYTITRGIDVPVALGIN
jgi:sugar lactone lactonase YvrE